MSLLKEKYSPLSSLGLQAKEAAGRRRDLMLQEERSRREANAFYTAYVRGERTEIGLKLIYISYILS